MNATEISTRSLFELDDERRALIAEIEIAGGELSPDLEARWQAIDAAILSKVDACGWTIDRLEREAQAFRGRAAALAQMAQVREHMAARIRERLAESMRSQGTDKIGGADWTVTLRESERVVIEVPADRLPIRFQRVADPAPDKAAIKIALKAGEAVAGARIEKVPFISIR